MKKNCSCLTKRPKFERFTLDSCNLRQKVMEAIMKRASGLVAKSNVAIVGPRVRFPAGAAQWSIMLNFSVKKGFRYLNFWKFCTKSSLGMWHSGSASALHAESPGFDSPHLHATTFEWSRVRFTLGAATVVGTYSSEVERSIADMLELLFFSHHHCGFLWLLVPKNHPVVPAHPLMHTHISLRFFIPPRPYPYVFEWPFLSRLDR